MMKSAARQANSSIYPSLSARRRLSLLTLAVMATFATTPAVAEITDSKTWTSDDLSADRIKLANKDNVVLDASGHDLNIIKKQYSPYGLSAENSTFTLNAKDFKIPRFSDTLANNSVKLDQSTGMLNLTGDFESGTLTVDNHSTLRINDAQNIILGGNLKTDNGSTTVITLSGKLHLKDKYALEASGTSSLTITADSAEIFAVKALEKKRGTPDDTVNNISLYTKGDISTRYVWTRTSGVNTLESDNGNITVTSYNPTAVSSTKGTNLLKALNGSIILGVEDASKDTSIDSDGEGITQVNAKDILVYGRVFSRDRGKTYLRATENLAIKATSTYKEKSYSIYNRTSSIADFKGKNIELLGTAKATEGSTLTVTATEILTVAPKDNHNQYSLWTTMANSTITAQGKTVELDGTIRAGTGSAVSVTATDSLSLSTKEDGFEYAIWTYGQDGKVTLDGHNLNIKGVALVNDSATLRFQSTGTTDLRASDRSGRKYHQSIFAYGKGKVVGEVQNLASHDTIWAQTDSAITLNVTDKASLYAGENQRDAVVAQSGASIEVKAKRLDTHGGLLASGKNSVLKLDSEHYQFTGSNASDTRIVAQDNSTLILNSSGEGTIETLTPNETSAYIAIDNSTLKMGGAKHLVKGSVYFANDAQFVLHNPDQLAVTTLNVENYDQMLAFEDDAPEERLGVLVKGSDIDLTGLNGEYRTRKLVNGVNTYQGFAVSKDEMLLKETAVQVREGGHLKLDKAGNTIVGTVLVTGASEGDNPVPSKLTIGPETLMAFYGDALAMNAGEVDLTLVSGSHWEGFADDWQDLTMKHVTPSSDSDASRIKATSGGKLSVTMAGGAWVNRGLSSFSTLSFEEPRDNAPLGRMARAVKVSSASNSNTIDLTKDAGGALYADTVKGKTGSFRMLFNSDHTKGNMLYMKNVADGADANFTVDAVIPDGVDPTALEGLRFATTGKVTNDSLFTVQSENDGFNNIKYEVKNEAFDATNADNADYNDGKFKPGSEWVSKQFADGLNWYLAKPVVEVSEGGEVVLGTARSLYWQSVELDRLNKRLGERRMSREDDNGLWIRLRHSRLGTDTGSGDFTSRNTTYQVGYDYTHAESDGKRLFGFAVDYRDGNTDYDTVRGDGEANRFGLTAYSTWLADSGWYWDAVAKCGRLHHSFDIVNTSGKSVTGDFHNNAYGFSFELGRKLAKADSAWFLEPQAQVQFTTVSGGHYYTNQGSFVDQDRINSFVSRLGVRAGRTLGEEKTGEIYAKADWLREWHGKQRMSVTDKTTGADGTDASISHKGNWFDVGLGFQHTLTQNTYAYVDVEYRFGNDLERTWDVNAGLRWQF